MKCPICSKVGSKIIYKLYDDRYGYKCYVDLMICQSCGHKFINHNFTSKEIIDLYSNYYPRTNMRCEDYCELNYKRNFISWLNGAKSGAFTYVPKNVKILDIGCGFGESLGYHRKRGCDVYGVETDLNVAKVADKFGFKVKLGFFDPNDYPKNFFDYVTMDQVLEHFSNPVDVLKGVYSILKVGGVCVISTPNANGWGSWFFKHKWINWHVPYHLNFFSKKSIQIAAKKAGLSIEKVKTITSSEWLHYQWIHLLTYPKLGEKSSFWDPRAKPMPIYKKTIIKFLIILHRMKVNHILTRFFDTLGLGDNYIIILKKLG